MAQPLQPEKAYFKDDGSIPNSALPLLVYRQAFTLGSSDLAGTIEEHFARNDWTGSWRASVFPFHHYHSTTHEVLAVYRGTATLQFGGEKGRKFALKPGDVVVIPAGVGHKRTESSLDGHGGFTDPLIIRLSRSFRAWPCGWRIPGVPLCFTPGYLEAQLRC